MLESADCYCCGQCETQTKVIVKPKWSSGTDPEFPAHKVWNGAEISTCELWNTVTRENGTAQIQATNDLRKSHFLFIIDFDAHRMVPSRFH